MSICAGYFHFYFFQLCVDLEHENQKKIKSDLITLNTLTIFTDLTTLTILKAPQKNYGECKCRIFLNFEVYEIIRFFKVVCHND